MLWGLGVHIVSGKIQARPRRTCSMVAFFRWQADERLCEKACGMSFIFAGTKNACGSRKKAISCFFVVETAVS